MARKPNITKSRPGSVVGANWVTNPQRPKSKGKAKKLSDQGASKENGVISGSSSGILNLNSVTFTWFLDSKDRAGKKPTLSASQVDSLKMYLDSLFSSG